MSWQMAMMAAQAGVGIASSISSATRGAAAIDRGIGRLHEAENQAAAETRMNVLGTEVRGAQYLTQAAQTDVTAAEVGIRTAQQEKARRVALDHLMQANAIDLVARGGVQTGQDSAAAIENYNRDVTEEDVGTIKLMGESAKRQLSFRKKNFELSAMGEQLRGQFARLAGAFKQENLEGQIEEAGAKARDLGSDAIFKVLGSLTGMGASMSGGSGGGGGGDPSPGGLGKTASGNVFG